MASIATIVRMITPIGIYLRLRTNAEQISRIVGVIQIAVTIGNHRGHAIVCPIAHRHIEFRSLRISQFVYVNATARRIAWIISLYIAIKREVDIRISISRRHQRSALRIPTKRFTVRPCHFCNAHSGKIDNRQHTLGTIGSTDKGIAVGYRGGRSRRTSKLHASDFGKITPLIDFQTMQHAIFRNGIHEIAVHNERRAGARFGDSNIAHNTRKVFCERLCITAIVNDNVMSIHKYATSPIITGFLVAKYTRNSAREHIDPTQSSCSSAIARIECVNRRKIHIAIRHGQRRQILITKRVTYPQSLKRGGRNSLQISTRQRNHNDAV